MTRKMQVHELQRRAEVRPQSLDLKQRTIEVIFSTGARVLRRPFSLWDDAEPYWEELSLDPAHVRLDRLNNGAPFLKVHNDYCLESVLGVVEGAATDGTTGTASVRFSEREDVEPFFRDIASGIIRHTSVGYKVHRYEEMPAAEDGIRVFRATDWEPLELSAVPIGADDGAVVRSQSQQSNECVINFLEDQMSLKLKREEQAAADAANDDAVNKQEQQNDTPERVETAVEAPVAAPSVEEARAEGAKVERARASEIRRIVEVAKLESSVAEKLINDGTPLDAARSKVIDLLAERDQATPTRIARVEVGEMRNREAFIDGVGRALSHRANPKAELPDVAREYRGMILMDMARETIERAGGRVRGLSRREIAVAALNLDRDIMSRAGMHSSSDFPQIIANTVNRTLRESYELAPRTFVPFCRKSTASDFKEVARVQMSEMSKFQKVKETGEYKYITFGDSAEKYSLAKSGGIIAVTWESIINDDLSAFDRIPTALAEEAAATEGDIVYAILTGNPQMADGIALFHADHGNLASAAAAITDTSLGLARAAMRKQKGAKGRVLNITPRYLVVGPDKEAEAIKYTSVLYVATKPSDINPEYNTSLTPIVDPRITGNAWHTIAEPTRLDTIEYAYLEGEEGLFTEQRTGFEVDGIEIKARHVFAAKAIDYRTMYKNSGA